LDPKQLKIIFNYLVARSSSTYISDALGHLRHYDLDSLPRRELCQDDPHREKLVVGLFERVYCDSESRGSNHVGSEPRKDVSHLYLHVCLVVVDKIFGALLDHQVHVPHLAAGEGWAQGRPQAFPFFSAHEQQVFGQERVRVGLAETDVTLEVVEVLRGDLLDEVKIADQKEVLSELHVPNISFFWIFVVEVETDGGEGTPLQHDCPHAPHQRPRPGMFHPSILPVAARSYQLVVDQNAHEDSQNEEKHRRQLVRTLPKIDWSVNCSSEYL
jgi:hypothetical protein